MNCSARILRTVFALVTVTALHAGESGVKKKKVKTPEVVEPAAAWDFCEWLDDNPGLLYREKKSWLLNRVVIGGRFQYQMARVDGRDINGQHFHDSYDDVRRARLESRVDFLRYFRFDANVDLVDDDRFRGGAGNDRDWGYEGFDKLTLRLDLDDLFQLQWLDKLHLSYGKMKVEMGEESHQSSRDIYTIERSALSDRIGTDVHRPTGLMLDLGKDDWQLSLGAFGNQDNSSALASWAKGQFYYASLGWKASEQWRLVLDYAVDDSSRNSDSVLGYAQAVSLSAVYNEKDWGVMSNVVWGDNGGARYGNANARRQGDFYGFVVMPWYWILEDQLQFVAAWQFQASSREEGINLNPRYVRGKHDNPLLNIRNGRGDRSNEFYTGLNYHLCNSHAKIMGGVTYTDLSARGGDVRAWTYSLALRMWF